MELELAGKKVIVSAATRGVARAIAERFLDEGATVSICGRRARRSDPNAADPEVHSNPLLGDGVEEAVEALSARGTVYGAVVDCGPCLWDAAYPHLKAAAPSARSRRCRRLYRERAGVVDHRSESHRGRRVHPQHQILTPPRLRACGAQPSDRGYTPISTSSPLMRTGYVFNGWIAGAPSTAPVRQSNDAPCNGQIKRLPRSRPSCIFA